MSARFAHLQVHSHYSLMRGVPGPEALCVAAEKRGFDTLALTDTDGLYGAVRFFEVAKSAGLRPILGAEVTTPLPARGVAGTRAAVGPEGSGGPGAFGDPENGKAAAPNPNGPRATLLVRDDEGYSNLCRILTRRHLDPRFEVGPALAAQGRGLVVLSASLPLLKGLREGRPARDLYLSLGPVGASATGARRGGILKAIADARRLGIEPVAVNDVHFLDPGDYEKHLLLRAIDGNTTLDRVSPDELVPPSAWFKPVDEMERLVPHCPESLETAARIADECARAQPPWGPHVHPRFADLGGDVPGDSYALLVARCDEGARRRYGSIPKAVRQRLDYELAIVRDKGYADYFLVVQEIVRRSPRTCGRGSAAASIISYCLGITHVEPIRHDLYFERFLNRGRVDPPDIDVDFCWDERDDVIAWVFKAFGADRVAMITNHVTFRARAAVREIAKVHGLPVGEIKRVTDRLAHDWGHETAVEAATNHPLFRGEDMQARSGGLLGRPPWPAILASATAIDGAPRHLSVHCGGVVIAPRGVDAHVPVEMSTKGVRVIQWEKDQAEDAGLVKIDLLGNRSLSVIRDACAALAADGGPVIPYDEFDPIDDAATQAILRDGDTMGVFYVESPAMRQLQQKTRRGDFEHLVIHSSIIRPAANDYIREYVRRLRGGAFEPLHPILGEVMRDTYGIMVYQEDVARVAIRMAGFTDAEADGLRKVISKKWAEKQVADFRRRFTEGALARGIDPGIVEQVWRMILSFSGYSFCKPHSASYALVSFKSAWLKAHHPAEFMAAVLKNEGGYYSPFAYVSECRRMGIEVRPPDVNASGKSWTGRSAAATEPAPESGAAAAARGWIRIGLGQIVGLKEKAVDALLAEREKRGPFADFDALLRRLTLDPADLRRLVRAGALDTLDRSVAGGAGGPLAARTRLHWRLRAWETRGAVRRPGKTPELFAPEPVSLPGVKGPAPDEAAANAGRLLRDEEEAIGYLISRHPLTLYREALLALRRSGVQPVRGADMGRHVGERVAMVGWLVTGKIVTTKDDEPMEFVSFEDTTAIYETVFFPRAYERFCRMLTTARPYVLRGKIEEEFSVATLRVEEVEFLRRETRHKGDGLHARHKGDGLHARHRGDGLHARLGVSRGGAVAAGGGAAAAPAAGRPGSPRTTPSGRPGPRRGTPDPPA